MTRPPVTDGSTELTEVRLRASSYFPVVPLLGVVRLFLLTRDRQTPSRAPDMAIRREQSGRGGTLQSNNTLQGDYRGMERCLKLSFSTWTTRC